MKKKIVFKKYKTPKSKRATIITRHMQTDYDKFMDILSNQLPDDRHNGWPKIEHVEESESNGQKSIVLPKEEVGFVFTEKGRFVGMYNWNE